MTGDIAQIFLNLSLFLLIDRHRNGRGRRRWNEKENRGRIRGM